MKALTFIVSLCFIFSSFLNPQFAIAHSESSSDSVQLTSGASISDVNMLMQAKTQQAILEALMKMTKKEGFKWTNGFNRLVDGATKIMIISGVVVAFMAVYKVASFLGLRGNSENSVFSNKALQDNEELKRTLELTQLLLKKNHNQQSASSDDGESDLNGSIFIQDKCTTENALLHTGPKYEALNKACKSLGTPLDELDLFRTGESIAKTGSAEEITKYKSYFVTMPSKERERVRSLFER